jgi:hypothetical protein
VRPRFEDPLYQEIVSRLAGKGFPAGKDLSCFRAPRHSFPTRLPINSKCRVAPATSFAKVASSKRSVRHPSIHGIGWLLSSIGTVGQTPLYREKLSRPNIGQLAVTWRFSSANAERTSAERNRFSPRRETTPFSRRESVSRRTGGNRLGSDRVGEFGESSDRTKRCAHAQFVSLQEGGEITDNRSSAAVCARHKRPREIVT